MATDQFSAKVPSKKKLLNKSKTATLKHLMEDMKLNVQKIKLPNKTTKKWLVTRMHEAKKSITMKIDQPTSDFRKGTFKKITRFESLPTELVLKIAKELDMESAVSLKYSCRRLYLKSDADTTQLAPCARSAMVRYLEHDGVDSGPLYCDICKVRHPRYYFDGASVLAPDISATCVNLVRARPRDRVCILVASHLIFTAPGNPMR